MDLSNIFEYGVGIAGIGGMIAIVWMFMRFLSNHFGEATKASQKLADAIEQMLRFLDRKN